MGFPRGSAVTNPPANAGDTGIRALSLGWEDPPEKEMVTQYFCLGSAWTEEPGGLQSMGCKELDVTERHDCFTTLCSFLLCSSEPVM